MDGPLSGEAKRRLGRQSSIKAKDLELQAFQVIPFYPVSSNRDIFILSHICNLSLSTFLLPANMIISLLSWKNLLDPSTQVNYCPISFLPCIAKLKKGDYNWCLYFPFSHFLLNLLQSGFWKCSLQSNQWFHSCQIQWPFLNPCFPWPLCSLWHYWSLSSFLYAVFPIRIQAPW